MSSLQHYLVSLTAAAFLTAICQAAMPPGTVKRVSAFTCALLLFVVTVRPILRTDYSLLLNEWEKAYAALAVHDEALEAADFSLTEQLIVRQTNAYIQNKAEEHHWPCKAEVSCRAESSLPIPDSVTVWGTLSNEEREALTALIDADLDIPPERVTFVEEKGGKTDGWVDVRPEKAD